MKSEAEDWIRVAALDEIRVRHGFGLRCSPALDAVRPEQVHGRTVAHVDDSGAPVPARADAILSDRPGCAVAVLTADCVPLLAADAAGRMVAAIHAGWRGLAAGVIEAALAELMAKGARELRVAIGPAIGACCYEVDAPVLDALEASYGALALEAASTPTRPGHRRVALAALAERSAVRAGVAPERVVRLADACTACDPDRFHSYRRDGAAAGRLVHFIAPVGPEEEG